MENLAVPKEIQETFKKHYPTIDLEEVEWSWEVPGKIYEAEFDLDGQEYEVEITITGHWLLTEHGISLREVPKVVQLAFGDDYADYVIESTTYIEFSNGTIAYEFDLISASSGEYLEVIYRADGAKIAAGLDL